MRYTVVMPWVVRSYMSDCMAGCRFDPDSVLLVDNSVTNLGVQRAFNMGVDKMTRDDSDWLVYMSAAVRFRRPGGLDFIDQFTDGRLVVKAVGTTDIIWGWHLIAFHRETIHAAGRWDENLYPYCFDDVDFSMRLQRLYGDSPMRNGDDPRWWDSEAQVAAWDAGYAHGVNVGGVVCSAQPSIDYLTAKWGRHPDRPQDGYGYEHPFDDPVNPVGYWPARAIHGVIGQWDRMLPHD